MSTHSTASSVITRKVAVNFQGISKSKIIEIRGFATSPDPNGCVDDKFFHELLNGSYTRYYKDTGTIEYRVTDAKFWADAGIAENYLFDPRLILVNQAGISLKGVLFACQLGSKQILLATRDPWKGSSNWRGVRIQTDDIPDLPRLAYDFSSLSVVISSGHNYDQEIRYFPRLDAASVPPVTTNMRTFKYSRETAGETLHPVLDRNGTPGKYAFYIGIDTSGMVGLTYGWLEHGKPQRGLTFGKIGVEDFSYAVSRAHQPVDTPQNPNLIFGGSGIVTPPYRFKDDIWVVQHTFRDPNVAVRWYRLKVNESAEQPLSLSATGYIESGPPYLFDYFNASIIQVGENVVLCCNRSGSKGTSSNHNDANCGNAGVYAIYLQPDGKFQEQLIRAGLAPNYTSTSKWGDYSTICNDPDHSNTVWMINQFVLKGGLPGESDYATQIASIQF